MKKRANSLIVGALGAVSLLVLLNPGAGFVDLIPDNFPIIGNLDEAAAAAMLISCLAYFGLDLGALFGKAKRHEKREGAKTKGQTTTIDAEADVVER